MPPPPPQKPTVKDIIHQSTQLPKPQYSFHTDVRTVQDIMDVANPPLPPTPPPPPPPPSATPSLLTPSQRATHKASVHDIMNIAATNIQKATHGFHVNEANMTPLSHVSTPSFGFNTPVSTVPSPGSFHSLYRTPRSAPSPSMSMDLSGFSPS